jgi:hypothetical protein
MMGAASGRRLFYSRTNPGAAATAISVHATGTRQIVAGSICSTCLAAGRGSANVASATIGMIAKATSAAVFGKPKRTMSKVIGRRPKCVQAQIESHL